MQINILFIKILICIYNFNQEGLFQKLQTDIKEINHN